MRRILKTIEYICDRCYISEIIQSYNEYVLPEDWKTGSDEIEWSHGRTTVNTNHYCSTCCKVERKRKKLTE